jgi:hypothetical protein
MEGRLMLSTTVDSFMPVGLAPVQISFAGDAAIVTRSSSTVTTRSVDGGFIAAPLSPITDSFIDSDSVNGVPFHEQAAPDPPLNHQPSEFPPATNVDGTTGDSMLLSGFDGVFSGLNSGSFGIQPSVIPVVESTDSTPLVAGPERDTFGQVEGSSNEGGAISIAAILTNVGSFEGSELDERILPIFAAANSDEASVPARMLNATTRDNSEISGEWARAMAFEMAGGEPSGVERDADDGRAARHEASSGAMVPDVRGPISYYDAQRAGANRAIHRPSAVLQGATGRVQAGQASDPLDFAQVSHADVTPLSHSFFAAVRQSSNNATGAAELTSASALINTAHADIFGQLGLADIEIDQRWPMDFSWRGALNATPLLMILALERIAASNSRRANRDDAFLSAIKPRRSRFSIEQSERD